MKPRHVFGSHPQWILQAPRDPFAHMLAWLWFTTNGVDKIGQKITWSVIV